MKGHTQRQIAEISKIALVTVNEDIPVLQAEAKQNISRYIDEYLSAEYENCLDGLNSILVQAWTMSSDAESDKKERTQWPRIISTKATGGTQVIVNSKEEALAGTSGTSFDFSRSFILQQNTGHRVLVSLPMANFLTNY